MESHIFDVNRQLSQNIKQLRILFKMKQIEFAKLFNVNSTLISKIEKGTICPSCAFVYNVCKHFGVSIDVFYSRTISAYDIPSSDAQLMMLDSEFPEFDASPSHLKRLQHYANRTLYGYYYDSDPTKNRIAVLTLWLKNVDSQGYIKCYVRSLIDESCQTNKSCAHCKEMHNCQKFRAYRGKLIIPDGSIGYIFLDALSDRRERALIMLHHYSGMRFPYCGGLALMLSLSSGNAPCPCSQRIALSRAPLSNDAVKSFLTGHSPNIARAYVTREEDIAIFKQLLKPRQ